MQKENQPTQGGGVILAAKHTIVGYMAAVAEHPDEVAESLAVLARSAGESPTFAPKFAAGAVAYLSKHGEALAECTPQTFLGAIIALAQVGLTLDPAAGLAYIIAYSRKIKGKDGKEVWIKEAQLSISYKGYTTLMKRQYPKLHIDMQYILKGERFIYDLAQSAIVAHEANLDLRSLPEPQKYERMTFVYCKIYPYGAEKPNAYKEIEMMSYQDVERHRLMNKSQNKDGNPLPIKDAWEKAPFSMAYAKLLRKVVKKHITIDPKGLPKENIAVDEGYSYSARIDTEDVELHAEYTPPPASEAEAVTPSTLEEQTQKFWQELNSIADDPTTCRENAHERLMVVYGKAKNFYGSDKQLPPKFIERCTEIKNNAPEAPKTQSEGDENG